MHCSLCGLYESEHATHNAHDYEPCFSNGEERVDLGCVGCEREHPAYFAEAAYYKSLYERTARVAANNREAARADHERGHPERPLIGLTERILGTEAHS